jgi:hypothetical protein
MDVTHDRRTFQGRTKGQNQKAIICKTISSVTENEVSDQNDQTSCVTIITLSLQI